MGLDTDSEGLGRAVERIRLAGYGELRDLLGA